MTVPISAYFLVPLVALLSLWFRKDLLAIAIASSVFQAASVLDLSVGGSTFGVPIWLPFFCVACVVEGSRKLHIQQDHRSQGAANINALLSATAFFAYALISAFLMPVIFSGMQMGTGVSTRHQGISTVAFSSTNLSQSAYLVLSGITFYWCSRQRQLRLAHRITSWYITACCMAALVGLYQVISQAYGLYYPKEVLYSNAAYVQLADVEVSHMYRLTATFSEASMAALFFAGGLGIVLGRCASSRPNGGDIVKALLFTTVLLLTFSTTAYITLILGLLWFAVKVVRSSLASSRSIIVGGVMCLVGIGAFLVLRSSAAQIIDTVTTTVLSDKVESDSFVQRHEADLAALTLFRDTAYLGAGWGTFRASSAYVQLLANVGLLGTVAFSIFIANVFLFTKKTGRSTLQDQIALGAGLMLVAHVAAVPDMVNPAVWAFLGLLTRQARETRRTRRLVLPPPIGQTHLPRCVHVV